MNKKKSAGGNGRRARTRTRILQAARKVIKKHGMQDTTIRKVADEADVSPSLVMQYFQTKSELIHEIFLESNKILLELFKDRMASAESFLELVMGALEALSARDLHDPELTRQVMAFTWSWGPGEEQQFSDTLRDMSKIVENSASVHFLPDDKELRRVASYGLLNLYVGYLRIALQEKWSARKLMKAIEPGVLVFICGLEVLNKQNLDTAAE